MKDLTDGSIAKNILQTAVPIAGVGAAGDIMFIVPALTRQTLGAGADTVLAGTLIAGWGAGFPMGVAGEFRRRLVLSAASPA
jgi:hypothetical protein